MKKLNQEVKILQIVANSKDLPTYEVIRRGINWYVGNPDRILRRLQNKGYVFGQFLDSRTRYKFWNITKSGKIYLKQITYTLKNRE